MFQAEKPAVQRDGGSKEEAGERVGVKMRMHQGHKVQAKNTQRRLEDGLHSEKGDRSGYRQRYGGNKGNQKTRPHKDSS